jgi:phosphohistidine phosphatase SixA
LLTLLLCLLASTSTLAEPLLDDAALLRALRAGGHNIYFRHVATDWSQNDDLRQADDWRSCDAKRMRQLSPSGRAAAETIGVAIRQLEIPVGEVLASPYCRTVETAELMRLGDVITTIQVMNMRAADFVGGRASIIASAQALLASRPPAGNRVIVAHGNVASAATPAYPQEGEALVFAPDGNGGFVLRGRITVSDWSRLLKIAGQ